MQSQKSSKTSNSAVAVLLTPTILHQGLTVSKAVYYFGRSANNGTLLASTLAGMALGMFAFGALYNLPMMQQKPNIIGFHWRRWRLLWPPHRLV
ncbi:unnamed protein product [Ceratitis capitata]|uniref:(Mediterranean fruit fly) hypothetical protein n=1 Tax=Ceratitis capitata TaxID=7213 RepID=A0A811UC73_CERCA|nr:unnamed protein product [Ceratitis capitata]